MENRVRVLVIRFSSIGDIVLTTPVVRCLKKQLEGEVELHYLVKKKYSGLLANNPYVDVVHCIEKSTNEVMPQLKELAFDYIIDLHHNLRSLRVKSKLPVLAFSFRKYNVEKWLLVNFGINRMPDMHIVDRYFGAVMALGVKHDGKGLDYFIPTEEEVDLAVLPTHFQQGYIAFAIGGTYEGKKLPLFKLEEICKAVSLPVVLLGGKEDTAVANELASKLGNKVWSACGNYTLNQSASFLRQATLVLTHDTGLMHIAAAFGKHIVSMWGATVPEFGMAPFQPGAHSVCIEAKHLAFRPTSKLGNRNSRKERRTMEELPVEEVLEAVERILEARPVSAQE